MQFEMVTSAEEFKLGYLVSKRHKYYLHYPVTILSFVT